MTVTSRADLQAQVRAWLGREKGESGQIGQLEDAGWWRVAADISGTVLIDKTERPLDRSTRSIEVSIRPFVAGTPAGDQDATPVGAMRFVLRDKAPVWVATAPLRAGEPAGCELVRLEMRVMRSRAAAWTGTCDSLKALRVRRPVDPGDVLLSSDVALPAAVARNEETGVVVRVGAVRIESRATALAEGRIGQEIPIRLAGQASVLKAKVLGAGEVMVIKGQ